MRTEELIADLASRATPVRPLPPPSVRFAAWSAAALGSAAAGIAAFGLRPHLNELVRQPEFTGLAIVAVGTSALAGASSLVLAIPGAERSPALRATATTLVGGWAAVLLANVIRAGHGFSGVADWPICFLRVLAIALLPAIVLFQMLRRAAPLRRGWAAGLAATAAVSIAAGAIQFICPLADPAHALVGHFAPVLVGAGLAVWSAARLLK